jgi:hypothetical protein
MITSHTTRVVRFQRSLGEDMHWCRKNYFGRGIKKQTTPRISSPKRISTENIWILYSILLVPTEKDFVFIIRDTARAEGNT